MVMICWVSCFATVPVSVPYNARARAQAQDDAHLSFRPPPPPPTPQFENLAHIVHCIAELVFTATVSCMVSQIHHEIKYRERGPAVAEAAPSAPMADASSPLMGEKMER